MINIFGVIGAEVRAVDVIKQIQAIEGDTIDVVISSPGGSVFEGMAIYDALKASGKTINTSILGLGASIASVIFMAGDKREMGEGSQLMIHNALTTQGGNKHELSEAIDRLDAIDAQMTSIYINATGMDKGTVADMLKNETFMNADEAIEKGFATAKANAMAMVAVYNKQKEPLMAKSEIELDIKLPKEVSAFMALMSKMGSLFKAEEVKAVDDEKTKAMDHPDQEEVAGSALASLLNNAIDGKVTEERTRADIISSIASASGIEESTVNGILSADIDCPPESRLSGFAEVLELSMDSIMGAWSSDGCQVQEEAKDDSEVEALKAKIEALETELTAKHEADFIAKKDQVFEAIADNKLTLAEGKNLMAESNEAITEKLSGLQANATGYGNTGKELPNKAQASKAGVYESLKGFEKTAYFNENKKDIINELKGK